MIISKLQNDLISQDLQFVAIDVNGTVKQSDNKLIVFKKGALLKDYHPFFEVLPNCFEEKQMHNKFECVYLNDRIFDIDIINNNATNGVVILREGTDFYNRLQQIAQKRNESVIFNEVLEFKNQILKEKEEFKDKFIGNFSHELRNPLTLISAFSSMLLKTDLNVEQEQMIQAISEQSDRLKLIIEDIVDLSILKRNAIALDHEQFNFCKLIKDIELNYTARAFQEQLAINIHCDNSIPRILTGDVRRLEQIITYILEDSLQFNVNSNIDLTITENYRRANKVSINLNVKSKRGIIPENLKSTIASKKKEEYLATTDLGISIATELATLMQGSLESLMDSEGNLEHNVKIKLSIPLHVVAPKKTSKKSSPTDLKLTEKIKIIVAEDHGVSQLTALKVLVSSGNFDTTVYSDPAKLLEALEKNEYDVLLMASSISQIDAIELIGIIKEFSNKHNRKIPAIALTTQTKAEDLTLYRKAGFKSVIKKPYTDDEILSAIYKRLNLKKFK